MPRISVIMPVYNAEKYISQAVESILTQTFQDFEFLITDDGSTDGTLTILDRYADIDGRIILKHQDNIGYVRTLNLLLESACGEYIARMDADDIAMPERFMHQLAYLNNHPKCAVIGTRALCVSSENIPVYELFKETEHALIDRAHMDFAGSAILHPSVLMRHSLIQEIGGYRLKYSPAEDIDLWLRAAEHAKLANVPDLLMRYRLHQRSESQQRGREQINKMFSAVKEAYSRRGIRLPEDVEKRRVQLSKQTIQMSNYTLVQMAHRAKCYSNARKLALNSFKKEPWSLDSWRALMLGCAGRHASKFIAIKRSLKL
jgi:glycosyltransferase involved in cell wall biosynthesis